MTRYAAVLSLVALVFLPALVLAQDAPPAPNGHALLRLPPGEFQAYVSGLVEGQELLAEALGGPQAICVDPTMTRDHVASLVALGLSELPEVFLAFPARIVIFRVLIEKVPCPGFRWEGRNGE